MQKQYPIKWSDSDEKKLANYVRKFNAKITREFRAHPENWEYLPAKLSVKELKKQIHYRTTYNKTLRAIDRVFKPKALEVITTEAGKTITRYEKKELQYKINNINEQRAKELKWADVSTEKGTMGTIRENNLKAKKANVGKVRASDWDKFVESVNKQSMDTYFNTRHEEYKNNYLKAIDAVFGEMGEALKKRIAGITADKVVKMFYDNPVLQLEFIYAPEDMSEKLWAIQEQLEQYMTVSG